MSKQKKICFFNSCKSWGGGEKWHYEKLIRLNKKGYKTLILTNKKSELYKRLLNEKQNVKKIFISNFSFLNIFKIIYLANILRKQNINVLIINLPSDLKIAGIAAKIAKVDKIIYRRGSAIPIKNTFLNRFIFKNIVDEIIANSNKTKETILQNNANFINKDKIKVLYNGFDIREYDNKDYKILYKKKQNEIILGNAGRLNKQKGQKFLIEIAEKLKKRNINFKILIAGTGNIKDDLIKYAEKHQVEEKIIFLDFVENIKDFMQSIDIFLLPSLWEGFGYVNVEAMASNKPVLAFNISSNPEIIDDKKTGFLVEPYNIIDFADKVETLCKNKFLRKSLGDAGRKRVEEVFNEEKLFLQFENIINNT